MWRRFDAVWWGQAAGYGAAGLALVLGGIVGAALCYGVILPGPAVAAGRWLYANIGSGFVAVIAPPALVVLLFALAGGAGLALFVLLKLAARMLLRRLGNPDTPAKRFWTAFCATAYRAE